MVAECGHMVHLQKSMSIFRAAVSYLHFSKMSQFWESLFPQKSGARIQYEQFGPENRPIPSQKERLVFQASFFRGYVKLRERSKRHLEREMSNNSSLMEEMAKKQQPKNHRKSRDKLNYLLSALQDFMISDIINITNWLVWSKKELYMDHPKDTSFLWTSRAVLLRNNLSHNP